MESPPPTRHRLPADVLLIALSLGGLVDVVAAAEEVPSVGWREDGAGFEAVEDPARELFAVPEPWHDLARAGSPEEALGTVLTLTHDVPISDGETLRVREYFTLRSWLRWPKRAVLFLTTTSVTADLWTIPVEGYNGPWMAAQRGMFAFTVDYIGVGENYRPGADALDSTFERNLDALRRVVRYIRYFRAVPRVDLVGESWGGAHATQLAGDAARIRSCVMSSMTYKEIGDPRFVSPEFIAFLKTLENNYLPADPAMLDAMTPGAPEEVKAYARKTQAGLRLTTQLWQIIEVLPHFDPSVAAVPGLVISGGAESSDGRALAADYGSGGAQFYELPNAGHAPRLESLDIAHAFWSRVFEFMDNPGAP